MKSLFSNPTVIKNWEWDGKMECQTVLPIVTEDTNCVDIELDSESLLFRYLKLSRNKKAVSQAKPPKKPPQRIEPETDTAFLPAPIHKMTLKELKQTLKRLGLQTTGTPLEIKQRLENFINSGKTT